ncbi:MAG: RIP metalloprotease RseP, partial [Verrucomicrobia bacterium]
MMTHIARVILIILEVLGVWFGKPIWKKTINGVQYSLGSLPFGGFVALPQLAPMDIIEGKADVEREKLPRISAIDKIIVAFAGPFFSLLLALVFAGIVWVIGHPVSESDMTTTIGYVEKASPAEKAGLQPGDKILEVDGKPVKRFSGMNDSVIWNVVRSEGLTIPFKIERNGKQLTFDVVPYKAEARGWRRKSVRQVLILPAQTPIVEIALLEYISKHPNEELVLHVERNGSKLDIPVKPTPLLTAGEMKPRIGIQWDTSGIVSIQHPNPIEQVYNSVTSTLKTIGAVASPKSDVKLQHLSGPIGIGR